MTERPWERIGKDAGNPPTPSAPIDLGIAVNDEDVRLPGAPISTEPSDSGPAAQSNTPEKPKKTWSDIANEFEVKYNILVNTQAGERKDYLPSPNEIKAITYSVSSHSKLSNTRKAMALQAAIQHAFPDENIEGYDAAISAAYKKIFSENSETQLAQDKATIAAALKKLIRPDLDKQHFTGRAIKLSTNYIERSKDNKALPQVPDIENIIKQLPRERTQGKNADASIENVRRHIAYTFAISRVTGEEAQLLNDQYLETYKLVFPNEQAETTLSRDINQLKQAVEMSFKSALENHEAAVKRQIVDTALGTMDTASEETITRRVDIANNAFEFVKQGRPVTIDPKKYNPNASRPGEIKIQQEIKAVTQAVQNAWASHKLGSLSYAAKEKAREEEQRARS